MKEKLSYKDILNTADLYQDMLSIDMKDRILLGYDFMLSKSTGDLCIAKIPDCSSPCMIMISDLREPDTRICVYLVVNQFVFLATNNICTEIKDCACLPIDRIYTFALHLQAIGMEVYNINTFLWHMIVEGKGKYIKRWPSSTELLKGELSEE